MVRSSGLRRGPSPHASATRFVLLAALASGLLGCNGRGDSASRTVATEGGRASLNGSFDEGLAGWTTDAPSGTNGPTFTVEPQGRAGAGVRLQSNGAPSATISRATPKPLALSDLHVVSVWAFAPVADATIDLTLATAGSAPSTLAANRCLVPAGTWVRCLASVSVDAAAVGRTTVMSVSLLGAGSEIVLDDASHLSCGTSSTPACAIDTPDPAISAGAAWFSEAQGVTTSGGRIVSASDGAWVKFGSQGGNRFALGAPCHFRAFGITADVAAAGGKVEARLDSPTGPLVGSIDLAPRADGMRELEVPAAGVSGAHDLVFVFRAGPSGVGLSSLTAFHLQPGFQPGGRCGASDPSLGLSVAISNVSGPFFATALPKLHLEGVTAGPVSDLRWWVNETASGQVARAGSSWRATIPVPLGRSVVTIAARTASGALETARLVVTRTHALTISGDVSVGPTPVFVGEANPLSVVVPLVIGASAQPATLRLERREAGVFKTLATLTDDGAASSGDATAGDGRFSGKFTTTPPQAGSWVLHAAVTLTDGTIERVPIATIEARNHLTNADVDDARALIQTLGDLEASFTTEPEAVRREKILAAALASPLVETAGFALPVLSEHEREGLSLRFKAGFMGVVPRAPIGSRGRVEIGNRNVFSGRMFYQEFTGAQRVTGDEQDTLAAVIQEEKNDGRPFGTVTKLVDAAVTIEALSTITNYGLVAITTHGDTLKYYRAKRKRTNDRGEVVDAEDLVTSAPSPGAPVARVGQILKTNNPASGWKAYERLLLADEPSIVVDDHYLRVTDVFFSRLPGRFSRSFVYFGACRSAKVPAFWNALSSRGAGAFFGYVPYVLDQVATNVGGRLFTCLLKKKSPQGQPLTYTECLREFDPPAGGTVTYNGKTATCVEAADARWSDEVAKKLFDDRAFPNFYPNKLDDACGIGHGALKHHQGATRGGPPTSEPPVGAFADDDLVVGLSCPADRPAWNATTGLCVSNDTCGGVPRPSSEGQVAYGFRNDTCPPNSSSPAYTRHYVCCAGAWIDVNGNADHCGGCGVKVPPPMTFPTCDFDHPICGVSYSCAGGAPVPNTGCYEFVPG